MQRDCEGDDNDGRTKFIHTNTHRSNEWETWKESARIVVSFNVRSKFRRKLESNIYMDVLAFGVRRADDKAMNENDNGNL